jgi:MYXO-CTERM domain-containing protein
VKAALLGGVLVLVLGATAATTYVRTRTDDGSQCLHWPAGSLVFTQSSEGDPVLGDAGFDAVTRAWQTWQTQMVACGDLTLSEGPRSASRAIGFSPGAPSTNLVLFRQALCSTVVDAGDPCLSSGSCGNLHDCWDHTSGVLALTTVTFQTKDGVIVDTDVEFNAAQAYFTTVDSPPCDPSAESLACVANDTQGTATHEFGHALGLAESPDPDSTMYTYAAIGETSKRVLDPGSQQFVCDVYPEGRPSQGCLLADGGVAGTGGCSATGTGAAPTAFASLLGLLLLGTRRRRR